MESFGGSSARIHPAILLHYGQCSCHGAGGEDPAGILARPGWDSGAERWDQDWGGPAGASKVLVGAPGLLCLS